METIANISINLSADDLIKLIEATAAARPTPAHQVANVDLGRDTAQNLPPEKPQPLWCGLLNCGGSIEV